MDQGFVGMPSLYGEAWVFERGLIFTSSRLGSMVVDFEAHAGAVDILDDKVEEDGVNVLHVVVHLTCNEGIASFSRYGILEASYRASGTESPATLVFAFSGAARRTIADTVLPAWREGLGKIQVRTKGVIPRVFLLPQPESVAGRRSARAPSAGSNGDLHITSFLDHLQVCDAQLHHPASPRPMEPPVQNASRLVVFLGQPGCDKQRLVRGAIDLSGEATRWNIVVHRAVSSARPGGVDSAALAECLSRTAPGQGQRVALIISTYASSQEVARAILSDSPTCRRFALDRLVAIVNATSLTTPGALGIARNIAAQCEAGFVSCAVLVNGEQCAAERAGEVQRMLRSVNPSMNVIKAVAGRVVARADIETLLTLADTGSFSASSVPVDTHAFSAPLAAARRRELFPHWELGPFAVSSDKMNHRALWRDRQGAFVQLSFAVPAEALFVRTALVKAIRVLLAPSQESLAKFLEAHASAASTNDRVLPMKLDHLCAQVWVTHADRAPGAGQPGDRECFRVGDSAKLCLVKAHRGSVTVTPVASSEASSDPICFVEVSGLNLNCDELVRQLLAGRVAVPPRAKARTAADLTSEEHAEIKALLRQVRIYTSDIGGLNFTPCHS